MIFHNEVWSRRSGYQRSEQRLKKRMPDDANEHRLRPPHDVLGDVLLLHRLRALPHHLDQSSPVPPQTTVAGDLSRWESSYVT
jgi:hypothetical protein